MDTERQTAPGYSLTEMIEEAKRHHDQWSRPLLSAHEGIQVAARDYVAAMDAFGDTHPETFDALQNLRSANIELSYRVVKAAMSKKRTDQAHRST